MADPKRLDITTKYFNDMLFNTSICQTSIFILLVTYNWHIYFLLTYKWQAAGKESYVQKLILLSGSGFHSFVGKFFEEIQITDFTTKEIKSLLQSKVSEKCFEWTGEDLSGYYTGFVPFFINKFPGLIQGSDWFLRTLKLTLTFSLQRSQCYFFAVCHTFHIFTCHELNRFSELSKTGSLFPVLEKATIQFQGFPGFPVPVQTLQA